MILKEIISYLESRAHPALQESYDNSGLLTGSPEMEITGAIICLDSTEEVILEAISRGCNLVLAHHPIIFSGLKRITGKSYIERCVITAIKNDVAIYAIHTNLDNVIDGVNFRIAEVLGLRQVQVLEPKTSLLRKMVVFVPKSHEAIVRNTLFAAGAGQIGRYDNCSFNLEGTGTFRPGIGSQPFTGIPGRDHSEPEVRVEVILPAWKIDTIFQAMKRVHPYEEVAFDIYTVQNEWAEVGAGMIGELIQPMKALDFLNHLKQKMNAGSLRHTTLIDREIRTVAICGGSGSFLLQKAIAAKADVFVTADFKYHQFFDAEGQIIIADIGHYESEQFTMEMLNDWLKQKFPTFASHLTEVKTNPVHYL